MIIVPKNQEYNEILENIPDSVVSMAKCACVKCNTCTCACACRYTETEAELDDF